MTDDWQSTALQLLGDYLSELERPDGGYDLSPEGRAYIARVKSCIAAAPRPETLQHGFDRTASHSSGEYVCSCGDPTCHPQSDRAKELRAQPAHEEPVARALWHGGLTRERVGDCSNTGRWGQIFQPQFGAECKTGDKVVDLYLGPSPINQRAIEALKQARPYLARLFEIANYLAGKPAHQEAVEIGELRDRIDAILAEAEGRRTGNGSESGEPLLGENL